MFKHQYRSLRSACRRLGLVAGVTQAYWQHAATECAPVEGQAVRAFIGGTLALHCVNLLLLVGLVNRSAQGSIADVHARRHVAPLLQVKFVLIAPELALNVFATVWAFSDVVACSTTTKHQQLSEAVIEGDYN